MIPTRETPRLLLRPFTIADLDQLAAIVSQAEVMQYLAGGTPMTRDETEATIHAINRGWERARFGVWCVERKEGGEVMGWCGLKYLDGTEEVEVLYMIDKPCWNQGYTTEAAREALRFAFEDPGRDHIVAVAVPANRGSYRVMEKIGMTFERNARYYDLDLLCYSISREMFEATE